MVIKKQESKRIQTLKHKSRRQSIKEGIFASANFSIGERYFSPFAIAINASNSMVAMLGSITGLLGPISQLFGSKLIEKKSRKKIVLRNVLLQALMWLPIIIIALLFQFGIITKILPLVFLFFFSFYVIFSNIPYPAWFSWIGDIVDENFRGKWFSKRTLLKGFVSVVLALCSAFILDYFKKQNLAIIGFIVLFSLAMVCELMVWKSFKKQYEPKLKLKKGDYFSFWDFFKNIKKNNFGKFTIFRGLLAFSISISSPLVVIYLLRYLNFNYVTYILITISGTFFSLIFLELWGKIADKYGNYKVIVLTTLIIPFVPILWILSDSIIYLIFIPSMISGIVWAGFSLACGNLIYDNVSSQKRGLAISYYNMVIGIGIFLGAGLGALLIKFLTIKIIEPLFAIFIFGSILRMCVVYVLLPRVKEIKKHKKFKGRALRKMLLKETRPTIIEEAHEIMSIKKYVRE